MCFGILFSKISHHKVFLLPFIALVEFWFGLILSIFLEIRTWVYIKTQFTWLWIWIYYQFFE